MNPGIHYDSMILLIIILYDENKVYVTLYALLRKNTYFLSYFSNAGDMDTIVNNNNLPL